MHFFILCLNFLIFTHTFYFLCTFFHFAHKDASPVPVTPFEHTHTRAFCRSSLFAEFRVILSGGLAFAFALFHLGSNQRPLLFFGELFDSLHINAFCSLFISDRSLGRIPRMRSLGISPRVRFPVKPLGRTRSLSLRQLTRKRFGTKRIIRLLPALHISYKIYQFS